MAAVARLAGMTVFAGLAFSGASLLFKLSDHENYAKESHRHNLEMEKYARAHEAWNRRNILNEQKIRHLEQEKHNANINFNITNKNLEYLRNTKEVLLRREPKLSHYYNTAKI